ARCFSRNAPPLFTTLRRPTPRRGRTISGPDPFVSSVSPRWEVAMRRRRSSSARITSKPIASKSIASRPTADWPPPLRRLIRAAELECPPGHADALRELTTLALHKVPARGIFDPAARGEHELFGAIEAVARAHLEFADARTVWRKALRASTLTVNQRD